MKHLVKLAALCALLAPLVEAAELPGDVLLQYQDVQVTKQDLDTHLRYVLPEGAVREHQGDWEEWIRKQLADLFQRKMLVKEAMDKKLEQSPQYQARLDYQRDVLLMDMALTKVAEEMERPDFEARAREYYTANQKAFQMPERVRVAHILVQVTPERDDKAALAEAQRIAGLARAKGADFAALAREHSDDKSAAANGGDLGLFPRGTMVAEFENAAFAMTEPGTVSDPVKTGFGYHVIKFEERQPGRQMTFDEIKGRLISQAEEEFTRSVRLKKLADIRSLEGIEVNQEAVSGFTYTP